MPSAHAAARPGGGGSSSGSARARHGGDATRSRGARLRVAFFGGAHPQSRPSGPPPCSRGETPCSPPCAPASAASGGLCSSSTRACTHRTFSRCRPCRTRGSACPAPLTPRLRRSHRHSRRNHRSRSRSPRPRQGLRRPAPPCTAAAPMAPRSDLNRWPGDYARSGCCLMPGPPCCQQRRRNAALLAMLALPAADCGAQATTYAARHRPEFCCRVARARWDQATQSCPDGNKGPRTTCRHT